MLGASACQRSHGAVTLVIVSTCTITFADGGLGTFTLSDRLEYDLTVVFDLVSGYEVSWGTAVALTFAKVVNLLLWQWRQWLCRPPSPLPKAIVVLGIVHQILLWLQAPLALLSEALGQ